MKPHLAMPLPMNKTVLSISILLVLIFSKYIYMASLNSYYTFYLIHKFGVSVQQSQLFLFVFLIATAVGTLVGGPIGDRIGRKYVIWVSILGTAPFRYGDTQFLRWSDAFFRFSRYLAICTRVAS